MSRLLPSLLLVFLLLTSPSHTAGVQIRLAGSGSTRCSGRVEVYYNDTWGTICDDNWDFNNAKVVCRELGCDTAPSAPQSARFGEGTGPIWLDNVDCSGGERSLSECQHGGFGRHDCGHHEDAGVVCSGVQIRLAGSGSTQCSGRVEIYYNDTWGTVCDNSWDLNDATVVCRELGCGTARDAPQSAHFGQGSGQIWLHNVGCSGSERSLSECLNGGFGTHSCGHSNDTIVDCSVDSEAQTEPVKGGQRPLSTTPVGAQIRLTGSGSTLCSGRVEIYYNNTWGTVCDDDWDLNDANVVCKELGCGMALGAPESAYFGEGTGPIWLEDVDCSGNERSLTQCQHREFGTHNCRHSQDAGVVCSVSLPKPSISMKPIGEVTWGQDIGITCLIPIQHSVGTFILQKTSGSFRKTQTSSTNSATFSILKVNFDREGAYQCQYQIQISSRDFSSPLSDSVRLSVTGKEKYISCIFCFLSFLYSFVKKFQELK
ncbi:deleted in malignant brain tumors 1 protein-like [Morone saxatilis]|uniref:deleted in malignant brain tumors 1 protein-like n=1 Tax=Morone saxatilis TaxID=34816 RepID=UPI0015E221B8|nr:deleted in malignant brain tumors 1 protein-like [Morone saxatilis]